MTDRVSACAATAAASPVVSLSGRRAVNQNSGDSATTTVAHQARSSERSKARKNVKSGTIRRLPLMALQIANPRASGEAMPVLRSMAVDALPRATNSG